MKVLLKRIAHSDLLIFPDYYHAFIAKGGTSAQKAIALKAKVFRDQFYPILKTGSPGFKARHEVQLTAFGPGGAGPIEKTSAITLAGNNWRLGGAFLPAPPSDPARFSSMAEGDLAVMIFEGAPYPERVSLTFISQASPADTAIFKALNAEIGSQDAVSVNPLRIAAILAATPPGHAAHSLPVDPDVAAALESAVLGDDEAFGAASGTVAKPGANPLQNLTKDELKALLDQADATGRLGEALVDKLLETERLAGKLKSYSWMANDHAKCPYDFETTPGSGPKVRIDVKTTKGQFATRLFLAVSELKQAATGGLPYQIYRVYRAEAGKPAKLRRSKDITKVATNLLSHVSSLPKHVTIDGLWITPSLLEWESEEVISAI